MKICWDNLENLRLDKNGNFKKNRNCFIEKEACKNCGEPYLTQKGNQTEYCSQSCSLKGREISNKHREKISKSRKGQKSAFKGCSHSQQSKNKMSKTKKDNGSVKGERNPRYNDHRTWEEIHGKEKADRLKQQKGDLQRGKNNPNAGEKHWVNRKSEKELEEWRKNISEGQWWGEYTKGKTVEEIFGEEKGKEIKENISKKTIEGNPTIIPTKYSRGYTGYYKEFFFRSLHELSYLIYLFENNIKFESAENKKHRIKYKDKRGKWRYHYPDFYLIDSDTLIEIKSKTNWNNNIDTNWRKAYYASFNVSQYYILTEDEFLQQEIYLYHWKDLINMYYNNEVKLTYDSINRLKIGE